MLGSVNRVKEIKQEDRELRLALLASGRVDDLSLLFDEFKDIITDDEVDFDEGADEDGDPIATRYDYSNVKLDRSQSEIEKEIAEILAQAATGQATFEEAEFSKWI